MLSSAPHPPKHRTCPARAAPERGQGPAGHRAGEPGARQESRVVGRSCLGLRVEVTGQARHWNVTVHSLLVLQPLWEVWDRRMNHGLSPEQTFFETPYFILGHLQVDCSALEQGEAICAVQQDALGGSTKDKEQGSTLRKYLRSITPGPAWRMDSGVLETFLSERGWELNTGQEQGYLRDHFCLLLGWLLQPRHVCNKNHVSNKW